MSRRGRTWTRRRRPPATAKRPRLTSDLAVELASVPPQFEQVTDRLLRLATEALDASSALIVHREGDSAVVERSYARDGRVEQPGARVRIPSSRAREAMRSGRPACIRQPGREGGVIQLAEVPLPTGGERPLFLLLRRGRSPRFQANDLHAMRIVASMGSLALHNTALSTEVSRARETASSALGALKGRNRQEAALVQIGQIALSRVPPGERLQAALDILARTLEVDLAAVAEIRADGRTALLRAGYGFKPGLVEVAVIPAMAGISPAYLMQRGGQCQVSELLRDHGVLSGISILVQVEGVPVAELGAFSTRPRAFSQADRQLLEQVGHVIPQALTAIHPMHAIAQSLDEVRRTGAARSELLARLVRAVEDERGKIARDIHDDVLQALGAIALRLQLLDEVADQEMRPLLEQLPRALEESINRLRTLIFDLRADVLEEGLAGALRLYLDQVRAAGGPDYRIVSGLQVEPPIETRLVAYRIAQEALSNVRKHAGATHVEVVLESKEGGVQVSVRDNGRGFDPAAETHGVPGHFGLTDMRERAELAGGTLRVESAPGHGTRIGFWIPIAAPASG